MNRIDILVEMYAILTGYSKRVCRKQILNSNIGKALLSENECCLYQQPTHNLWEFSLEINDDILNKARSYKDGCLFNYAYEIAVKCRPFIDLA